MEQQSQTESYFTRLRNLNIGLQSAVANKNKAKQYFTEAFTLLKSFNVNFNYQQLSSILTQKFDPDPDNVNLNGNKNDSVCFPNSNNTQNQQTNNENFPVFQKNTQQIEDQQIQQIPPNLKNLLNDKIQVQNLQFFFLELNMLIKNIGIYFENYSTTSDMLKGLVFICNYIIHMNKNFAPEFSKYLSILAFFYTNFDCEKSNHQTLALISQILDNQLKNKHSQSEQTPFITQNSQNKFSNNLQKLDLYQNIDSEDSHSISTQDCLPSPQNKNPNYQQKSHLFNPNNNNSCRNWAYDNFEWMNRKTFVQKIFQIDFEDIENDKKKIEDLKMLGVILTCFARNQEKIKEFRQLNQLKVFLIQNIKLAFELKSQKVVRELVYALCKIADQAKFNEKEILKNKTIEILIQLIENQQSYMLLFGAFKLLKVFWKSSIRRLAMLKQQLPQKLLSIYQTQPRPILIFIEEIFNSEQQILLKEFPGLFNALLQIVYKTSSKLQYKEENQSILKFIVKNMTKQQFDQVLQKLGQGLFSELSKQYGQLPDDFRIQQTILSILQQISQKFSPSQILAINPQHPPTLQKLLSLILSQLHQHLQTYLRKRETDKQSQFQQEIQEENQNQGNEDQDQPQFSLRRIPSSSELNDNSNLFQCKNEAVKLEECDAI